MLPANGDNLLLGRGSVLLDRFSNGASTGLRFLGNAEAVSRSMEDDTLEFRSSTQSLRPIIKEVTRERTIEYLITLNEYQMENLALSLMGDLVNSTLIAATASEATFDAVKQGHYYDLGRLTVSAVVVEDDTTPTAVVFGVTDDYTVDAARGLIYIVPGGAITDGTNLVITFNAAAGALQQLRGGIRTSIEGLFQFWSDNASGPNYKVEAHKVSITPEGELGLITDEFGSFQIRLKVLDDSANHPDAPLDTIEIFTATA